MKKSRITRIIDLHYPWISYVAGDVRTVYNNIARRIIKLHLAGSKYLRTCNTFSFEGAPPDNSLINIKKPLLIYSIKWILRARKEIHNYLISKIFFVSGYLPCLLLGTSKQEVLINTKRRGPIASLVSAWSVCFDLPAPAQKLQIRLAVLSKYELRPKHTYRRQVAGHWQYR